MRQAIVRRGPEVRRKVLLATVFLTPLFFLRSAYNAFNVPKLWLLMVAAIFVLAIRCVELLQGADRSGLTLMFVPAGAVAGALLVGTIFSPYRVWALVGDHSRFTGLIPYLVVILLGILIADTFRGHVGPLAWAIVASGAVAGAYAIVQVLGLDPLEWSAAQQATVTIGNTNFSGAFFGICLPIGVGLLLAEPQKRLQAGFALALILAGWVLARSELAWAGGVAGLLVLSGGLLSGRHSAARFVGLAGAGVIAATAVAFVAVAATNDPPTLTPETIRRRAEWWEASGRMAADSLVFGSGPNAFAIEHTQYRDIEDVEAAGFDVTDDPHSVPLAFLTSAGVFGIAAFVCFSVWIIRGLRGADSNSRLGVAFGAAAVAYLVQSLLSVDVVTLRFAAWTAVAGMAAAFAPAPRPATKPAPGRKGKRKAKMKQAPEPLRSLPAVVGVILVAGVALAWVTGFLSADVSFRRGLSLAAGGEPGAKESFERAVNFRGSNYTYRSEYGRLLGGNAVQEGLAEDGDAAVARDLLEEAKEAFGIIDRIPHANTVVEYARVMRDWAQVDDSAEDEALALYDRALQLDPNNFRILDEQAEAAASFGRTDLAAALASQSQALRNSSGS